MGTVARVARRAYFRAFVALFFLVVHLGAISRFAAVHFAQPFNNAPGEAPTFDGLDYTVGATNWNRLAVSRWDSGQYICMALDRLYGHCPREDLRKADLNAIYSCDLAFFPGYPAIGWLASFGGRLPVDYALLGASLLASFVLLFLWTGPIVVNALGLWGAYCSLLLFNVYTTGFTLVTVLSEPCTMLFVFAACIALEKRWFIRGALLAGAASGMRITGLCAPLAYTCAVLYWIWTEEGLPLKVWLRTLLIVPPLSAWGILLMMAYEWWRFRDPFIYAHAHAQLFEHKPELWHLFWPDAAWIVKSMGSGVHDVGIAAILGLFFALGHRPGLRGFSRAGQVYWYVQFVVAFCLPLYGSAQLGYTGVTRYMLALFGAFFAMGAVLKNKPVALVVWCAISGWHYWYADLCYFEQHGQAGGSDQCLIDARTSP